MAGLLDQFIQQFTGGAPNESSAAEYQQRFLSEHENDREFDNATYHQAATEHLQQLPDDQFHQAAQQAITEAPPQQRADLLGTLLSALGGGMAGGGAGNLGSMLGGAGGAGGGIAQ